MRVRCVDSTDLSKCLTFWKDYEILREDDKRYYVIDDEGNSTGFFKCRFEIINEVKDKAEGTKIVRKLKDLNGLENGMGLHICWEEIKCRLELRKEDSVINWYCFSDVVNLGLEYVLSIFKAMGFKFEYKILRTTEEVFEEIHKECSDVLKGEYTYTLHVRNDDGIYFSRGNTKSYPIGCKMFITEEQARKYVNELNEIVKNKQQLD